MNSVRTKNLSCLSTTWPEKARCYCRGCTEQALYNSEMQNHSAGAARFAFPLGSMWVPWQRCPRKLLQRRGAEAALRLLLLKADPQLPPAEHTEEGSRMHCVGMRAPRGGTESHYRAPKSPSVAKGRWHTQCHGVCAWKPARVFRCPGRNCLEWWPRIHQT